MLADLPRQCNVGSKKNSKGYLECWVGYKLHPDVADGQIPISCILTSASVHDSQAAIPLAESTALQFMVRNRESPRLILPLDKASHGVALF